ncbi:MAG: prenyltransferase [Chloroflexi bacterium]|nr:prenyltransferase [Chloroflexota bacterium]
MFKSILQLARPLHLFMAALAYLLGVGMARYLGFSSDPEAMLLGLFWLLLVLSGGDLVSESLRLSPKPYTPDETPRQRTAYRAVLLQVAAAVFVLAAGLTVYLAFTGRLETASMILMSVIFILLVVYSVPPFIFSAKGVGEFVQAVLLAGMAPALAFLLQAGESHRLLGAFTFPLVLIALAWLMVSEFPTFASDVKYSRHTLLTRLTWQKAIPLHHALLGAAYLLFAVLPLLGFPWSLTWPALLTFPLGLVQIHWLQRIARGGRPVWKFILALSASVFGLTVYFQALTFWLR